MIPKRTIMKLNPQIIEKEGKKEFVVLPYKEYQAIQELMEDYLDLLDLRETKLTEKDQPSTSLDEVIKEIDKTS
jgi:hypothetical protein